MQRYFQDLITKILIPGIQSIVFAIVVLTVGMIVIKWGVKKLKILMDKSRIDINLKPFIISMIDALLKVFLIVSVIGILGVQTSSFVAVLASAGLAIGLAFQGSLSNIAGGILLLTTKPIAVGNFIETNGYSGNVQAIKILYTEIVTPDNKVIFIPNGSLANSSIVNYSIKDTRRVDMKFGVSYEANNSEVISVLKDVISKQPLVLNDPAPFVRMSEHGENAVMYTMRLWVKSQNYWEVYFNVIEEVKKHFDEKSISIPYPQMDVHIKNT
ncbi:MAG: Small-conductance mechanosensitive channel [Firmicutes bacterium ADurb.Bin419]|nr:MAG: Small-conductance mechanosensitive channel [Firmicutes bacterium ADurb.Bin419]